MADTIDDAGREAEKRIVNIGLGVKDDRADWQKVSDAVLAVGSSHGRKLDTIVTQTAPVTKTKRGQAKDKGPWMGLAAAVGLVLKPLWDEIVKWLS